MDTFIRTLTEVLHQHFQGAEIELEQARPAKRVGGFLIWNGFEGIDQTQRQAQVWQVLRDNLGELDQGRITAILTVTPAELSVMREGEIEAREELFNHLRGMSRDLHATPKQFIQMEIPDQDGVWRVKPVDSSNLSQVLQDIRQQIQHLKGKPPKRFLQPAGLRNK